MLSFDSFSNNKEVIQSLKAALNHRFPQTVLLTGGEGSGKWSLAQTLAAGLLCTSKINKPCGTCKSCQKLIHNSHPDIECIDYDDQEISVAIARDLRKKIHMLPNDSDRRVVLIRHAHKLNISAQNALLKVLEEPPKYAFFILTSEQEGGILETIRSRCSKYHLAPKNDDFDLSFLDNIKSFINALSNADEYKMLVTAMSFEKLSKPELKNILGLIQAALHDCIFIANNLSGNVLPEIGQKELSNKVSYDKLIKLYDFIGTLRLRIQGNAAPNIVCASLCAEAYQICFM